MPNRIRQIFSGKKVSSANFKDITDAINNTDSLNTDELDELEVLFKARLAGFKTDGFVPTTSIVKTEEDDSPNASLGLVFDTTNYTSFYCTSFYGKNTTQDSDIHVEIKDTDSSVVLRALISLSATTNAIDTAQTIPYPIHVTNDYAVNGLFQTHSANDNCYFYGMGRQL